MKFDCEARNYANNMLQWIASLEDFDKSKHGVGEIYCNITSNMRPLIGMSVLVTRINDKRAIIIAAQPTPLEVIFAKVYYPTKVEVAYYDYNEYGKSMTSIRVDDKFWAYEERFSGRPVNAGGIIANFGMDMTMPFLEQQDFKILE